MSKKPKTVIAEQETEAPGVRNAKLALLPSINAAAVVEKYQGNVMGKEIDMSSLIEGLRDTFDEAKDGDLSQLEEMLIGQATALQSIFVSLARRAQVQEYQKNLESFLGLALKAQAQSRATIQAVVELKYPRQVAFVKQANISHGPQQVNNSGDCRSNTHAHAEEKQIQQNELLEDKSHGRTQMDTGAAPAAGRSNPALEAVGAINRADKRRR